MNLQNQDDFNTLLNNLMSENNTIRFNAESIFHETKNKQPNELIRLLVQYGRTHQASPVRIYCIGGLLRPILNLEEPTNFSKLNAETQMILKTELLNAMEHEKDTTVKKHVCDIISDVFLMIFKEKEIWNDVINWSFASIKSPNQDIQYFAFRILKNVSNFFSQIPSVSEKFNIITEALVIGFNSPSIKVQIEALYTASTVIQHYIKKKKKELAQVIGPMVQVIANAITAKDEINVQKSIQVFVSIADSTPGILIPQINLITDAMIKLGSSDALSEDINRLAGEFLVTLAENIPKLCMQSSDFINSCVQIFLKMMVNMPDTPIDKWKVMEDDTQIDVKNYLVAEEFLDRLSMCLGGDILLPIIWIYLQQFAENPNWKFRHSAYKALTMIAEGCADLLHQKINDIAALIIRGFDDQDPRVRFAAINAAGQLSTDLGPLLQTHFHKQFIPLFLKLMSETDQPKNQAFAAAALVNFCEKFDSVILEGYLSNIFPVLIKLLGVNHRQVQEQAITAIASIASCCKQKFASYYDIFIPNLKNMFLSANGVEYRGLRGRIMECISLISLAVGKDIFLKDANEILGILKNAQESVVDYDDPQREYFRQAWTRFCTCIKLDFVPYLPYVITPLLKDVSQTVDVKVAGENNNNEEGWKYIIVDDDVKIGIHTAALEDKKNSCKCLYVYAFELKEGFFPYVEQTANIIIPLVQYKYNDIVRNVAMSILPHLLNSTKLYLTSKNQDMGTLYQLFNYMYPVIFNVIDKEEYLANIETATEQIHKCIHVVGTNCLTNDQLRASIVRIKEVVVWLREKRGKTSAIDDDDDQESVLADLELESESNIVLELIEWMGTLLKTHCEPLVQIFKDLNFYDFLFDLIKEDKPTTEKQMGLCVMDDIIEFHKEKTYHIFDKFIPHLIKYSKDSFPEIRQASTYGIGVVVEQGGTAVHPYMEKLLNTLLEVIQAPNSRNKKNAYPTENAISSVGKIIQFQPQVCGNKLPEIMKAWLHWLPMEYDEIESRTVMERLYFFINTNHPHIFGDNYINLPKILSIFALTIQTKFVRKENNDAFIILLKQIKAQIPAIYHNAYLTLPPHVQERLALLLA